MKLEGLMVRNEEISAMQFFHPILDDKGAVKTPANFDIILKSGVVLHYFSDESTFSKAVDSLMIE